MGENGINLEQGVDFSQISKDIGPKEAEKMLSFADIYPEEEIRGDMATVWRAEAYFREHNKMLGINKMEEKFGDNLEYIIDKSAEQNDWFGENSFLTKTIKYDDYVNRVDFVLEYDISDGGEEPKRLALIVDCTSSTEKVKRKILTNLTSMELGKTRVKYFESQVDDFRGEIVCIPVVIGLDGEHVWQLLENIKDHRFLEKSPAQILFLEEIRAQLRFYRLALSDKKGDFSQALQKIESVQKIIGGVLDQKDELLTSEKTIEYLNSDGVCREILAIVK